MSFFYSTTSRGRLQTCHPKIQAVFNEVIKHVDCTIICGFRGQEEQNEAFRTGHSKKQWPDGAHNTNRSLAIDAVSCPIDWNDRERHTLFAGFVLGVAAMLDVQLTWGGDWNRDWRVRDNRFDDLVHFELAHTRIREDDT